MPSAHTPIHSFIYPLTQSTIDISIPSMTQLIITLQLNFLLIAKTRASAQIAWSMQAHYVHRKWIILTNNNLTLSSLLLRLASKLEPFIHSSTYWWDI